VWGRVCVCVCARARVHTRHRASAQLQGMHAVHFVLYSMCPRYSSTNHLHAHTHTNTHKHAHAHAQTHTHTNTHNTYTHTHTHETPPPWQPEGHPWAIRPLCVLVLNSVTSTPICTDIFRECVLFIGTQFSNLHTDLCLCWERGLLMVAVQQMQW